MFARMRALIRRGNAWHASKDRLFSIVNAQLQGQKLTAEVVAGLPAALQTALGEVDLALTLTLNLALALTLTPNRVGGGDAERGVKSGAPVYGPKAVQGIQHRHDSSMQRARVWVNGRTRVNGRVRVRVRAMQRAVPLKVAALSPHLTGAPVRWTNPNPNPNPLRWSRCQPANASSLLSASAGSLVCPTSARSSRVPSGAMKRSCSLGRILSSRFQL